MSLRLSMILIPIFAISACNSNETPKSQKSSPAVEDSTEDMARKRIHEFYSVYISERAGIPEDTQKIDRLLKEYCTDSFANHLEAVYAHGELEADPIIDTQDFDAGWLKTLTVQKNNSGDYLVCYVDSYNDQKHCLNVYVVNENGKWKINNIMSSM